jgi:4-amino-4-deoxy-L-arabinose transferase-like glycosyltransferase
MLGAGFLTKGPIALLLPGLGLLVLAWQRRERARELSAASLLLAAAAFLAVTLPWFVLVQRRLGWEPLVYFFLHENLERFAGETYDSGRSPAFYAGAYALLGLPWSALVPCLIARLRRSALEAGEGRGERLLLFWIGLALLPLSVSRGKIDYYLLPLLPPVSLLVARFLRSEWTPFETSLLRITLAVAGLALAFLSAWASPPGVFLPGPSALPWLRLAGWASAAGLLLTAWRPGRARVSTSLASLSALGWLAAATLFLPALRRAQPNDAIVADVIRERGSRPEARLVYCDDPTRVSRELLFEARVASLERCDLWAQAESKAPLLLLVREGQQETLRASTRFVGEYPYVPATVMTLRGLLDGVSSDRLVLLANFDAGDPEGEKRKRQERKRRVREREKRDVRGTGEAGVP